MAETQETDHTYKFNIFMPCDKCSTAVEQKLKPLEGVKSYDISLETQLVTVITDSSLSYETVLSTIAKADKKINSGEADGLVRSVEIGVEA